MQPTKICSTSRVVAAALALALLASSSARAEKIEIDRTSEVDLTRFETYAWKPRPERKEDVLADGSRVDLLIRSAVDEVLAERGLRPVAEAPDFYLTFDAGLFDVFVPDREDRMAEPLTVESSVTHSRNGLRYDRGTIALSILADDGEKLLLLAIGRDKMGAARPAAMGPKPERKIDKLATRIARKLPLR